MENQKTQPWAHVSTQMHMCFYLKRKSTKITDVSQMDRQTGTDAQ